MKREILTWTDSNKEVICKKEEPENGVYEYTYEIPESEKEETLWVEWYEDVTNTVGCWYPDCGYVRAYGADWQRRRTTSLSVSAPVYCLYDQRGNNCITIALSEAVRETEWKIGVHEEDGRFLFQCKIHMGRGRSEVKLYINEGKTVYSRVLGKVQTWWKDGCGIVPAIVPEAAKMPFYSTWYSYHQNMEEKQLERECELAAQMGFKGIIVDDGWQTDDNHRGYAFCGDWKPSETKFPHMREHVAYVHFLGMKYMLWVSIPFIGKNSGIWKKFSDKLLEYQEEMNAGVADIRYKEVREYLMEQYVDLVKNYDLDGLKMDFIDEFHEGAATPEYNENMDFRDVQDALEHMMVQLYEKLRELKPDILIEFRQKYVGPYIRKFGNILRVDDCPMSQLSNRVGLVDLRILSGDTAVHSDMVMWNKAEEPEGVAIALQHCFFGSLQLSVRLEECRQEVLEVIRYYMELAQEWFEARLEGELAAEHPEHLYPVVYGEKENRAVVGVYEEDQVICVKENWTEALILNANKGNSLYLDLMQTSGKKAVIRDCKGAVVKTLKKLQEGLIKIEIPAGGMVKLF
ncbi:glycoside hydrolase family 36 protein [Waltera sp.]|jgi:alpha-galactosidase|uniref:glycoside hydrolase family 36 protein n=1 Tax=Waltera sp. TaxID=2815806 RepID=UPI003AB9963B